MELKLYYNKKYQKVVKQNILNFLMIILPI